MGIYLEHWEKEQLRIAGWFSLLPPDLFLGGEQDVALF